MIQESISSPDAMMALGAKFAGEAKAGNIFGLVGTLGTGKTHWTKGFLTACQPEAIVTSPTFSLVNEYRQGSPPVHHFDFYRLKSANELLALGWDEYLEDPAVIICEWADLFPDMMPENTRWLQFTHQKDDSRLITEIPRPDPTANRKI